MFGSIRNNFGFIPEGQYNHKSEIFQLSSRFMPTTFGEDTFQMGEYGSIF